MKNEEIFETEMGIISANQHYEPDDCVSITQKQMTGECNTIILFSKDEAKHLVRFLNNYIQS